MRCPRCDSNRLTWTVANRVTNGVVDGRLRAHDVEAMFTLGCDECSETIGVISADDVADLLTRTKVTTP
jgi:uncharacterized protein (DUF983 family)